jgi:hypothetical protein
MAAQASAARIRGCETWTRASQRTTRKLRGKRIERLGCLRRRATHRVHQYSILLGWHLPIFLIFNLLEQYSVSTSYQSYGRTLGVIPHRDWPWLAPHLPPMGERPLSVCEYDRLRTLQGHRTRTTRLASLLSILPSRGRPRHVSAMPRCCYRPSVHNGIGGGEVRYRKGGAYHGKQVDSSLSIVQLDQE